MSRIKKLFPMKREDKEKRVGGVYTYREGDE